MALKVLQKRGQTARILRTNPIQLEAIGHEQSDALLVFGDLNGEWFDPGIELLLGQLSGQFVDARLPQRLTCIHLDFWGRSLGHVVFVFVDREEEKRQDS